MAAAVGLLGVAELEARAAAEVPPRDRAALGAAVRRRLVRREHDARRRELRPAQRSHRVGRHVVAAERRRDLARQRPAARSASSSSSAATASPSSSPSSMLRAARAAPRRPSTRSSPWPSARARPPSPPPRRRRSRCRRCRQRWPRPRGSSSLSPESRSSSSEAAPAASAVAAASGSAAAAGVATAATAAAALKPPPLPFRKVGRRRAPCAWRGGSWRGFASAATTRSRPRDTARSPARAPARCSVRQRAWPPAVPRRSRLGSCTMDHGLLYELASRVISMAFSGACGRALTRTRDQRRTPFWLVGERRVRRRRCFSLWHPLSQPREEPPIAGLPPPHPRAPDRRPPRTPTTTTTPSAPTPSRRPSTSTRTPRRAAPAGGGDGGREQARFQRERNYGL